MTTTIGPALGHGALMTQQGVGATPGYDAIDARRFWSAGLQEGVISSGSYMVTQRGAGSNLSVDIAASTGDGAIVQGDAVTAQGLYFVAPHTAVINEAITTAHATLPRIDQVVLEIKDTQHDASGSNLAQTRVVAGTATAAATLDNRNGAAALPSSAMLLADVLVAATDTAISNAEIRDRRPWARGAFATQTGSGSNYTRNNVANALVDSANLTPRIECSGSPLRMTFSGAWGGPVSTTASAIVFIDGVAASVPIRGYNTGAGGVGLNWEFNLSWVFTPTAGSHLIGPAWATTGAWTIYATNGPDLVIEELVRQNTKNNTTTTG